jgi:hypothetical protein
MKVLAIVQVSVSSFLYNFFLLQLPELIYERIGDLACSNLAVLSAKRKIIALGLKSAYSYL